VAKPHIIKETDPIKCANYKPLFLPYLFIIVPTNISEKIPNEN